MRQVIAAGAQSSRLKSRRKSALQVSLDAWATRATFGWKTRAALYRLIATRLRHNIELDRILDMYAMQLRRRKKQSAAKLMDRISRQMRNGSTFADAARPWIPVDEMMMIASGEHASNLADAVELIGDVKSRIQRVIRTIRKGATVPLVYIAAIYGYLWAIGTYLTPKLALVADPTKATGTARAVYMLGDVATSYWSLLPAGLLVAVVLLIARSMARYCGPGRTFAERYVPFSFYRDIQGYMWLLSFAALLKSGMQDITAIRLQRQHGNPWLRHRLGSILPLMVDHGMLFPAALRATRLDFPNPDMIDDIEAVWGFPDSNDRLLNVTRQWADDLEHRMTDRIAMLSLVFEMIMYGVIGFVMAGSNEIGNQLGTVVMP